MKASPECPLVENSAVVRSFQGLLSCRIYLISFLMFFGKKFSSLSYFGSWALYHFNKLSISFPLVSLRPSHTRLKTLNIITFSSQCILFFREKTVSKALFLYCKNIDGKCRWIVCRLQCWQSITLHPSN